MNDPSIFTLLTKLVVSKSGEMQQRAAVDGVLRAFGWSVLPTMTSGALDGVPVRLYFWRGTPIGDVILCVQREGEPWVSLAETLRVKAPGVFQRVFAAPPRAELKKLGQQQSQDPAFSARVIAGIEKARAAGKHIGRPLRASIDLDAAEALLRRGFGLKSAGKELGVSDATLRRHLVLAGRWPIRE